MKKLYSTFIVLCLCASAFAHDFSMANQLNGLGGYKYIYYRITSTEVPTVAVTFQGATPTSYKEYTTYIVIPTVVTWQSVTYQVTSVDANAFYDCTGLDSVLLPSSITFIDSLAFGGCTKMTKCVMPSNVNFIGEKAFMGCTNLTKINLPTNITKISDETFFNCNKLTEITFTDMINYIGKNAFRSCTSLTDINFTDAGTTVSIGNHAFSDCYALKTLNLHDRVTSIDDYAFCNCTGLETITLSSTVANIGFFAFGGCFGLKSIDVDTDNPKYMSENGVLYTHSQNTLLIYPPKKPEVEFTAPDKVKLVGDYAFMYSLFLKNVNFNSSLKKIGTSAFYYCTGLSVVSMLDSVSYMGEGAFYNCKNLDTIKISSATPPEFQEFSFYSVRDRVSVVVPCDLVEVYQSSDWGAYFQNINGYGCMPDNTDIEEIATFQQQDEDIFPNPVEDELYINTDEALEQVDIYSLSGILITSKYNSNIISISNLSLPKGIYIVKIRTSNNKLIVRKIIKN